VEQKCEIISPRNHERCFTRTTSVPAYSNQSLRIDGRRPARGASKVRENTTMPLPTALAAAEAPAVAGDAAAATAATGASPPSAVPPSPSSPAFDPRLALKGRYYIPADEVRELVSGSGPFAFAGGADALLLALLPAAAALARPPVSRFHVGAAALAGSGAVYVGANVEQPGSPLNQSLHAEQFLVCNLIARGETRLRTLAISAAPCGHCRQFYCELSRADEVRFVFGGGGASGSSASPATAADGEGERGAAAAAVATTGATTGAATGAAAGATGRAAAPPPPPRAYTLDELLPARFGPLDLLVPHDPVTEAARRAAARHDRPLPLAAAAVNTAAEGVDPEAEGAAAAPPPASALPALLLEAQDNRVAVAPWVLAGKGPEAAFPSTPFLSAREAAALAARAAEDPTFRAAVAAAARAARHGSYAPYTRAPSGAAFITRGGLAPRAVADVDADSVAGAAGAGGAAAASAPAASAAVEGGFVAIVGGSVGYLESAAYNPGVPPFQAALAAGLALGEIRGLQDVAEVLVAELDEEPAAAAGAAGAAGGGGGGGESGGGGGGPGGDTAGLVKHAFVTEAVVRAASAGFGGVRVWRVPLARM